MSSPNKALFQSEIYPYFDLKYNPTRNKPLFRLQLSLELSKPLF